MKGNTVTIEALVEQIVKPTFHERIRDTKEQLVTLVEQFSSIPADQITPFLSEELLPFVRAQANHFAQFTYVSVQAQQASQVLLGT